MLVVRVSMKFTNEPVKRTPVILYLDTDPEHPIAGTTDRGGVANFDIPVASGKIVVSGATRYHGRLEGDIPIELWSPTDAGSVTEYGTPDGSEGGSIAYPGMQVRKLRVNGHEIETDSEGYLVNPGDWSEAFVRAQAADEGLELNNEIWEVIRFLRDFYEVRHIQANVREMIKYFRKTWGPERGSNQYLHTLFPRGGPQKQGNRLAGLLRTKGEH
jgi:tRNA 2-thiouridine synthesizing protein E